MRKKRYLITIIMVILLLPIGFGITYWLNKEAISEQDFEKYISYDEKFLDIEAEFLNNKGYVLSDDIPQLLNEIETVIKDGIQQGAIKNYTREEDNILIEFTSGINYLFIPYEEDTLSNGDGGKILTIEPEKNTYAVNHELFLTTIEKYYNNLEYTGSYTPVGNANLVKETFDEIYDYNNIAIDAKTLKPIYAFSDQEVTVESMKDWKDSSIIIFEGHGGYNSKYHSILETGESFLGFEEFSKYSKDIKKEYIILTSFPKIIGTDIPYSPVRQYCITSKFIEEYVDLKENSLVFLGACSSGVHIPQELRIRSGGTERHSASS